MPQPKDEVLEHFRASPTRGEQLTTRLTVAVYDALDERFRSGDDSDDLDEPAQSAFVNHAIAEALFREVPLHEATRAYLGVKNSPFEKLEKLRNEVFHCHPLPWRVEYESSTEASIVDKSGHSIDCLRPWFDDAFDSASVGNGLRSQTLAFVVDVVNKYHHYTLRADPAPDEGDEVDEGAEGDEDDEGAKKMPQHTCAIHPDAGAVMRGDFTGTFVDGWRDLVCAKCGATLASGLWRLNRHEEAMAQMHYSAMFLARRLQAEREITEMVERKCVEQLQAAKNNAAKDAAPTKKEIPIRKLRCIVHGCTNERCDGEFVGDMCAPCYKTVTTGVVGPTNSFLGDLRDLHDFRASICALVDLPLSYPAKAIVNHLKARLSTPAPSTECDEPEPLPNPGSHSRYFDEPERVLLLTVARLLSEQAGHYRSRLEKMIEEVATR